MNSYRDDLAKALSQTPTTYTPGGTGGASDGEQWTQPVQTPELTTGQDSAFKTMFGRDKEKTGYDPSSDIQAVETDQTLGEFASTYGPALAKMGIAVAMNNPLAVATSIAQMVGKSFQDPTEKSFVEKAFDAIVSTLAPTTYMGENGQGLAESGFGLGSLGGVGTGGYGVGDSGSGYAGSPGGGLGSGGLGVGLGTGTVGDLGKGFEGALADATGGNYGIGDGFGGGNDGGGRGGESSGHGGSAGGADGRGSAGGGPDGSNEGGAATGGF
jgi:hypothetical protein